MELFTNREDIEALQRFINAQIQRTDGGGIPGIELLAEDGVKGRKTRSALAVFQLHHQLDPTGEVDAQTYAAMTQEGFGSNPQYNPEPAISFTEPPYPASYPIESQSGGVDIVSGTHHSTDSTSSRYSIDIGSTGDWQEQTNAATRPTDKQIAAYVAMQAQEAPSPPAYIDLPDSGINGRFTQVRTPRRRF